jgi:hypothetical protein
VARGYITVDNVSVCSLDFPGDGGYFVDGGLGAANNVNALLGSYRIVEMAGERAYGGPAVHLEASSDDPRTSVGSYTFYARYSGGRDNRESLASTLAVPLGPGETELLYWRDSKVVQSPSSCFGTGPFWAPLSNNQTVSFDLEENPEVLETSPFSPPAGPGVVSFPYAAGRVTVGTPALPVSPDQGWIFLNLGTTTGSLIDPTIAQAWVGVVRDLPFGLGTVSQPAWQLLNTSEGQDPLLPCASNSPPPICGNFDGLFSDGFESGQLVGWDVVVH